MCARADRRARIGSVGTVGQVQIRRSTTLTAVLAAAVLLIGPTAVGAGAEPITAAVDSTETVRLVVDASPAALATLDASETSDATIHALGVAVVDVPMATVGRRAADLAALPGVHSVSLDVIVTPAAVPNDPYFGDQWALREAGAPAAWDVATGNANVVIAVLDTGVTAIPDLDGAFVEGWAAPSTQRESAPGSTSDVYGHGTYVAQVAAARGNNGVGTAGYCWGCSVMPVKVLSDAGSGLASDVAAGIVFATDNGADIINMSLLVAAYSSVLAAAVLRAQNAGVLVVAAAGNEASRTPMYPAGLPGVLAVGAHVPGGARTYYSNYGPSVELSAAGSHTVSDTTGAPYPFSGTSSAAPAIAGSLGVLLSAGASPSAAYNALLATATPASYVGFGLLNVGAAAAMVATGTVPTAPIPDTKSDGNGYRLLHANGAISPAANTTHLGAPPTASPTAAALTARPGGYWVASAAGTTYAFGAAPELTQGPSPLGRVVAMVATLSGNGAWLVDAAGVVRADGDAPPSDAAKLGQLNAPVVAAATSGVGMWRVAGDGGVFTSGTAAFHGSTGALVLNAPIVGIAVTPGGGYWLVSADGGVFAFGDAVFHGSTGALRLNQPVVGMMATGSGDGYLLVASDGGVFAFGDAIYSGSRANNPPGSPVVAIAPAL